MISLSMTLRMMNPLHTSISGSVYSEEIPHVPGVAVTITVGYSAANGAIHAHAEDVLTSSSQF